MTLKEMAKLNDLRQRKALYEKKIEEINKKIGNIEPVRYPVCSPKPHAEK